MSATVSVSAKKLEHVVFATGRLSVQCHFPGCGWPDQPHVCGDVYACEKHCGVCNPATKAEEKSGGPA
jgi:hypothetical protein